ncbi:Thioredoxin domain-containing protein [Bordetella sputigena]|uniref:TlpA family protein disulfide reductase n=1 Tax=Bordetella sputigena TaxID=1416810 RepID=UPI0039F04752
MKRRTVLRTLLLGGIPGAAPALVRAAPAAPAAPADSSAADPGAGLLAQTYPDLQGKPQPLAQWKSKPLVVNFWATWCPPCVKEMPELDELHKRHPQVGFLGLAVDTAPNVVKFVSKVPVSYTLLVAGPGVIDVMRKLGNAPGGLPFTLVLAADGRIRKQILGPVDIADLDRMLSAGVA